MKIRCIINCPICGKQFTRLECELRQRQSTCCSRVCANRLKPAVPRQISHSERVKSYWSNVDKTPGHGPKGDCWIWTGKVNKKGYGVSYDFRTGNGAIGKLFAHRAILLIVEGEIPPKHIQSCHSCDNPPCVNPAHLFKGTNLDNTMDKVSKLRQRRKLEPGQVLWIREQAVAGKSQSVIAKAVGISRESVRDVINGKTWKSV
jgi:hypothetical protein